jgi:hypothetical protein
MSNVGILYLRKKLYLRRRKHVTEDSTFPMIKLEN